jgi:nitroreductase
MMTVEEAVAGRRSIRAFLPTPVPRELIERVLAIAGRAPSGSNVQPWHVWVLQGAVRDEICREAVGRYDRGEASRREYNYYPVKWREH